MPVPFYNKCKFTVFGVIFGVSVCALFTWNTNRSNIISRVAKPQDNPQTPNVTPQANCNCGSLPKESVLQTFSHKDVANIYHNYVNSIQISCEVTSREGNTGDGGWDICLDPPFNLKAPCLVYSFGVKDDWTFDDAITSHYGCELHAYDPTVKLGDHDRKRNLHFHKTGLGKMDEINKSKWKMRTFKSLKLENGHPEATVDVLKMDIEQSEWDAIPQMLASGVFDKVKQFCFELHVKMNPEPEASLEKYIRGLGMLRDLYDAGFRIFKTSKNMDAKYHSKFGPLRTGCHEIYMIKNNNRTFG